MRATRFTKSIVRYVAIVTTVAGLLIPSVAAANALVETGFTEFSPGDVIPASTRSVTATKATTDVPVKIGFPLIPGFVP